MPIYIPQGQSYYFTDEYKTIVRSCKEVLLSQATFSPFVGDNIKFAYKYNFHKFLRQIGGDVSTIPEELIWTISFLNGIEDPNKDFSHLTGLYTVTMEQIESIIQITRVRRE
ncbi:hypothetical protein D5W64_13190 [Salmonella enterica subsp. enterica serovar Saintpaul]|nr:hypothetical protein [Salmonella enterica subsp. enterica serovar Saintpaul]